VDINISAKNGLGYYELKQHNLLFEEGCSKLLGQRKPAKLQWLQDPTQINEKILTIQDVKLENISGKGGGGK
jgi:hypothetical protein